MQPVQIKMARAALGLTVEELAKDAGVPAASIGTIEGGAEGDPATTQGLGLFFASHGIELIGSDGVRAKPPQAQSAVTVDNLTTGNDGGQG